MAVLLVDDKSEKGVHCTDEDLKAYLKWLQTPAVVGRVAIDESGSKPVPSRGP